MLTFWLGLFCPACRPFLGRSGFLTHILAISSIQSGESVNIRHSLKILRGSRHMFWRDVGRCVTAFRNGEVAENLRGRV
jgi:hypothetical protein